MWIVTVRSEEATDTFAIRSSNAKQNFDQMRTRSNYFGKYLEDPIFSDFRNIAKPNCYQILGIPRHVGLGGECRTQVEPLPGGVHSDALRLLQSVVHERHRLAPAIPEEHVQDLPTCLGAPKVAASFAGDTVRGQYLFCK